MAARIAHAQLCTCRHAELKQELGRVAGATGAASLDLQEVGPPALLPGHLLGVRELAAVGHVREVVQCGGKGMVTEV